MKTFANGFYYNSSDVKIYKTMKMFDKSERHVQRQRDNGEQMMPSK